MGWSDTWSDILAGGNPRWKVTNMESHQKALSHFQRFIRPPLPISPSSDESESEEVNVLCPLAGDDPFVYLLWSLGYSVTTIDLVPPAVEAMKEQFGCDADMWTKEEDSKSDTVVWKHKSGRASLMIGDALQHRPELMGKFDAVYDKDSFGALGMEMRAGFCNRMAEYTKKGGIIYLECKLKDGHEEILNVGPPYSLKRENIMEEKNGYGSSFDYVEELGIVYPLDMPPTIQQTGHILRRK